MLTSLGADDRLAAFRVAIKEFLRAELPANWAGFGALPADEREPFMKTWRQTLVDRGYLAPAWPRRFGGGGCSHVEAAVLAEEFALAGAPTGTPNDEVGITLLGNALLRWGTDEQQEHFLPKVVSGAHRWCQGYSEPDAGSDLANLSCRADMDGDEWIVNGTKLWTSFAQTANWMLLLVRTGGTTKYGGITFLLCPLDLPGIAVRPLRVMTGTNEFCEVAFTDVRVPRSNVVGAIGDGWKVAMTVLASERGSTALFLPVMFRTELGRLIELAGASGASKHPVVRQELAASYSRVEILRYAGLRALAAIMQGRPLGPESSLFKLMWSEHHKRLTELAVSIVGAEAMAPTGQRPSTAIRTDDPGAPNSSASWTHVFMNARAGTIYAGTSEIQRNVIAELVLGLPKDKREVG